MIATKNGFRYEVSRNDRLVRAYFGHGHDDIAADDAEELARALLVVVAEVRALPPAGWRTPAASPAPGTRVRYWRSPMRDDSGTLLSVKDMYGVVLKEPSRYGDYRVVVQWDRGEIGEPCWDTLLVEGP